MNKTIAVIILALAISLVACKSGEVTKTSWHLEFKNGVEGPSGVCELSADGSRILRTLSVERAGGATNELPSMRVTVVNWPLPKEINGYATNNQKELFNWHDASRPSNWYDWIQTVVTNWTTIGTYTPKTGSTEDVQRGNIVTNTIAVIEWKGIRHEFILESTPGPDCGERRVPGQHIWPQRLWPQQWPLDGHGWSITNFYHLDTNANWSAITNSVWIGMTNGSTTNNILTDRW